MAKIGLPKGSGKWSKVREKSGNFERILSGNPDVLCSNEIYTYRLKYKTTPAFNLGPSIRVNVKIRQNSCPFHIL